MNRALLFDFDGVISDDLDVKIDAFREMFSSFGSEIRDKVVDHHIRHGGISRAEKFSFYYKEYLNTELSDDKLQQLEQEFSELVSDKVLRSPLLPGVLDFAAQYKNDYICLVVSGTPQFEIYDTVKSLDILKYFQGVYGTPPKKKEMTRKIVDIYNIDVGKSWFFGDSAADMKSAENVGINFVLVKSKYNTTLQHECRYVIADFNDPALTDIIRP